MFRLGVQEVTGEAIQALTPVYADFCRLSAYEFAKKYRLSDYELSLILRAHFLMTEAVLNELQRADFERLTSVNRDFSTTSISKDGCGVSK